MWESLAIVAVEMFLGWLMNNSSENRAKNRQAAETEIRAIFNRLTDQLNIKITEIDKILNALDLKRSDLLSLTTGSARLSRASQKLREFMKQYPIKKSEYEKNKQIVSNLISEASSAADNRAKEAQSSSGNKQGLEKITDKAMEDALGIAWKANNLGQEGESTKVDTSKLVDWDVKDKKNKIDTSFVTDDPLLGGLVRDTLKGVH